MSDDPTPHHHHGVRSHKRPQTLTELILDRILMWLRVDTVIGFGVFITSCVIMWVELHPHHGA